MEEDLCFAVIECRTICPRCGGPLFLNGPAERVHCDRCQSEVDTPPDLWKSILETVVEDMGGFQEGEGSNSTMFTGNFQLSLTYGRLKPYCPSCKTEFPPVQDRPGENSWELTCGNCGEKMPVKHSPDWLRELLSQVLLILNAEESEPGGAKGELTGQLVVFSCPKCGGALDVDGSDRILECRYCGSKVYLPDDLWLRLHPAKTVQRWFVGISGPLKNPDEEEEEEGEEGEEPEAPPEDDAIVGEAEVTEEEQKRIRNRTRLGNLLAWLGLFIGASDATLFLGVAMRDWIRTDSLPTSFWVGLAILVSVSLSWKFREVGSWLLIAEGFVLVFLNTEFSLSSWGHPWMGVALIASGVLLNIGSAFSKKK